MSIQENILEKLITTGKTENIKVLHAIESGSRAWGFASPDSDYDVRFIYVRPKNYYLRLEKTRDVIECELNDIYDINGWDIAKTLRLLHNSNPTVFEWIHSPIVYSTHDIIKQLTPEIDSFFSCKSGIYHYISTALSNSRYLKPEHIKYKKYFYVIRPVMACLWILENKTPPPVLFSELVNAVADENIKPIIAELIRIKTEIPETATGKHIPELDSYIEKNIVNIKKYAGSMSDDRKNNWSEINEMFLKCLDI
ncbi:MAG: nucleotidyltransferase domain-containing protein [Prevotella sp.]|nr:nucleotidyltransferase domain-containing protein [Alistipes senegalensis]MCM1357743.1 nucleotidyltransferase domain-containing protein [Prevotella sp.]MCM1474072.1 nucleotidyltransferase domain-containing protein [Muribaculaceae bacterium]